MLTPTRPHCIPPSVLQPRKHNLLSYGMALVVFASVVMVRFRETGYFYSSLPSLTTNGLLGVVMWCCHFGRRSAESAWVHRYSKPSVPLGDVLIEYVYYWGFAAWIAVSLTPHEHPPQSNWLILPGLLLFGIAEWGNARAHRMLRHLRPEGSKVRVIPRGFLFERVSSPHYLFEILSWVGFALVVQTWAATAFLVVGAAILASWAKARHVAYLKEFDGLEGREKFPTSRRALIPGVF
jgi:very-long-chain enoyl-CoA reductase